jgi:hypothetical protein
MTDDYRMTLRIPGGLYTKILMERNKSDTNKPMNMFVLECIEKFLKENES